MQLLERAEHFQMKSLLAISLCNCTYKIKLMMFRRPEGTMDGEDQPFGVPVSTYCKNNEV